MATFLTMGSPNSRPLHLGDSVSDRPCCFEVGIGRSETMEMTPQSFAVGPRSAVHSTAVIRPMSFLLLRMVEAHFCSGLITRSSLGDRPTIGAR